MATASDRFFAIGLPELPLTTNKEIEPDLRDIYLALRNFTLLTGQAGGYEEPLAQYQNLANAAYTVGAYKRRLYVEATEDITYGELVNTYNSSGLKARLADASDATLPAHGICNTVGTSESGDIIEIVLSGAYITSVGGLTPGVTYYLSLTAGGMQNAAPTVVGQMVQAVGVAISATELFLNISSFGYVIPESGGGGGTGTAFKAVAASGQAVTGGGQVKINFGTEQYDLNNEFASSRFTCTEDGIYHFDTQVGFTSSAATNSVVNFKKNNTTFVGTGTQIDAAAFAYVASTDLLLVAGDYIEVFVYSSTNRTTTADGSNTFFSGHFVRAP